MTQQLNTIGYTRAAYHLQLINDMFVTNKMNIEENYQTIFTNFIEVFLIKEKLSKMTYQDLYYFTFNCLTIFEAQSVLIEEYKNANNSKAARMFLKEKMFDYINCIEDEDIKEEMLDFWCELEKQTENELRYLINL